MPYVNFDDANVNIKEACKTYETEKQYDPIAIGSMIVFILGLIHILVSWMLFLYYRRFYERLQARNPFLLLVATIGTIFQSVSGQIIRITLVPCYASFICGTMVVPLFGIAGVAHEYEFITKQIFGRMVVNFDIDKIYVDEGVLVERSVHQGISPIVAVSRQDSSKSGRFMIMFPSSSVRSLRYLKLVTSKPSTIMFVALFLIPYFIVCINEIYTVPFLNPVNGCIGCPYTTTSSALMVSATVIILLLLAIGMYQARHFKDHHGIKQQIFIGLGGGSIAVLGYVLYVAYPVGMVTTVFTFDWLIWVGCHIVHSANITFQVYVSLVYEERIHPSSALPSSKSHQYKTRITGASFSGDIMPISSSDIETTIGGRFKVCLGDPILHKEFEDYLVQEFSVENLRMYDECEKWKKEYYDCTPATRLVRAKRIFSLFVELNSVFFGEYHLCICS